MDKETAQQLVLNHYNARAFTHPDYEHVILPEKTIKKKYGWIFYVTLRKYLRPEETPKGYKALGTEYVIIKHDGTIIALLTNYHSLKAAIRETELLEGLIGRRHRILRWRLEQLKRRIRLKRTKTVTIPRLKFIEVALGNQTLTIGSKQIETLNQLIAQLREYAPEIQIDHVTRGIVVDYHLRNLQGREFEIFEWILNCLSHNGWEGFNVSGSPIDGPNYILRKKDL
jgi:hypothetical protein